MSPIMLEVPVVKGSLWLLMWIALPLVAGERIAEHVILISIDGFRPDFYRDAGWPAPNLQQMAAAGASADGVRGVFPSVTYPSHTTMITGAKPRRHGILYNSPFEDGGQTGAWYWFERSIQTETVWDAVGKAGLTSAALSWPVSVGAPVDFNVPEIWPLDRSVDLFDHLREHVTPKGLLDELERDATGKLTDKSFGTYSFVRDIRQAQAAAHLIVTRKPNLMTIHLIKTDFTQHGQGRDGGDVRRAVGMVDTAVGLIRESLELAGIAEKTAIIVTGDHGFVDIHTTLHPNAWLIEAGLRTSAHDRGDWKATFHTTGASAFLILREPGDRATVARVREVLEQLPRSRRKLFRVVDADELASIGAPEVPLALTPVEGISISGSPSDSDLTASGGGNHGYLPEFEDIRTGFIGFGAGFRKGERAKLIGLEDIAPMIVHLLGLEMATPDGTLYPGLFAERTDVE